MIKTSLGKTGQGIACLLLATALLFASCKKHDKPNPPDDGGKPSSYTAEVLDKWMTLQMRLMRNATGVPNHAFSRHFAYSGVAAIESLTPGLPAHQKWSGKWNGTIALPAPEPASRYYYPANVNAAMAAINKAFFPTASTADAAAIDSLEAALTQSFLQTQSTARIEGSIQYGKAVAAAVFQWAESDGYKNANNAHTPPTGPGLWKPTPPAFGNAATPYWGQNRPVISGSTQGTMPEAPPAYSAAPASAFYQMVKQVYDASQNLTADQKAMALFWRDVPGATSPGHWLNLLQSAVRHTNASLEKAALAYALTGAAGNDALITCFEAKYRCNLVRPVTYVREVMGVHDWSTQVNTPAHPEFPSAHSSLSAAAAGVLERLFGNIGTITDHTYDYLGFAPRSYASFTKIAEEAGQSRLYGGIHYQPSVDAGTWQGKTVAANIFQRLGF